MSLEENESAGKKFEQAASKKSYEPNCQIFHLKSYHWYRNIIRLACDYKVASVPRLNKLLFGLSI